MRQHFDHILASLRFERGDEVQPDFSRLFARKGVPSIEGHADEAIAALGVLEQIKQGREQGVHGHVIACFGDPGLLAARELTQELGMPVIDGVGAAVKMVESLVALGVGTSKYGDLAFPQEKKITGAFQHLN